MSSGAHKSLRAAILVLAACTGGEGGPQSTTDAGADASYAAGDGAVLDASFRDAAPAPDADAAVDAAVATDAGGRDASVVDASLPADAAFPGDAGSHLDAAAEDSGFADGGLVDTDAGARLFDAGPPRSHGLESRPINTTCRFPGAAPATVPALDLVQTRMLSNAPVRAHAVPGDPARALFVDGAGRVELVTLDDDAPPVLAVHLGGVLAPPPRGLIDAVLHPAWPAQPWLFASYVPAGEPLELVVARFSVDAAATSPATVGETVLTVALLDAARAGGALAFGHDGYLFIATGDGGDAQVAGALDELRGKILRIDVDAVGAGGRLYSIPPSNPFVATAGARGEVFARGLAAPKGCAVDPITSRLWCTDRGGAISDEIHPVRAGANLGWPERDGVTCLGGPASCVDATESLPAVTSPHRDGCGLVAGVVVRSARLAELQSVYVYGNTCTAEVRGLRFDGKNARGDTTVATVPGDLALVVQTADGDARVLGVTAAVYALRRKPGAVAPPFPVTLSATGCYAVTQARLPAVGLVPYEVRAPLWTDGAIKRRFLAIPENVAIGFSSAGAWGLPSGAILMKEFNLDAAPEVDGPLVPLETRFIIKRSDTTWETYAYMWDSAGTDGYLLDGSELKTYPVSGASGPREHPHAFPSRADCNLCHNANAHKTLGLETGRMNTDHDYAGFVDNQLSALSYAGLFDAALPAPVDELPRFPCLDDETAPLETRARTWLHGNCAHCHRPLGPPPTTIDLQYETPFAQTGTCGVTPSFGDVGVPGAQIIKPGSSSESALFLRLNRRGAQQMPPLGTLQVDPEGVALVAAWIDSLSACP